MKTLTKTKSLSFLIVSDTFPQPDKNSGDLRFYNLLTLLAKKHKVVFCALESNGNIQLSSNNKYANLLIAAGISLGEVSLSHMLKNKKPDVIWFEFYYHIRDDYLRLIKRYCPGTLIVVDSVDVHYNRLETKAKLTGKPEDKLAAENMKLCELEAYSHADMIIAVSENDKDLLRHELPDTPIEVLPNVHAIPPFPDIEKRRYGELIFVGGFKHDPNIDAMLYFCRKVLPIIVSKYPEVRLKIIGSHVPETIIALQNDHVEVLGYVPETAPYLESAYISVAPLRYGGGMKGKVGEAMSYGLPVVTSSFGAEGFGVQPGKELLIGDTPESFAAHVISLLHDKDLHHRIAKSGYKFIRRHYSVQSVSQNMNETINRLTHLPARKTSIISRLMMQTRSAYNRSIGWRISKLF